MKINDSQALTFDDVALVPQHSQIHSRSEVDLSWSLGPFDFKIPIIASNMTTVCGHEMAHKMHEVGGLGVLHRFMSIEDQFAVMNYFSGIMSPHAQSVGSIANDINRINMLLDNNFDGIICVDIAHGDSAHMWKTLAYLRKRGFSGPVVAGNVCTPDAVKALKEWGADTVKVGIGPGSVCTTRVKTGCGVPQFQAIVDCAKTGIPIIADGGIRNPGDAAKALAAGAKAVMVGGMLAGTDCVPGWGSDEDLFHSGNASSKVKNDFQQHNSNAEGVSVKVRRRPLGSTDAVIQSLVEGIKSACSYQGAKNLEELHEKAIFVRTTSSAVGESIPHLRS